jgi:hypothetical protein
MAKAKAKITDDVKNQVAEIVKRFNQTVDYPYIARYKGNYLYLDRKTYFGNAVPICRLEYTGDMQNWEFAIYKYSSERYDPEEWMFPGISHVDGTIEGAMKAGMEAYPD